MAAMSNAVRRTGRNQCDLCGNRGSERNPLTRHHVDGNSKNNDSLNHMVVHRVLCHTMADFITQMLKATGTVPTYKHIHAAWDLLMLNSWLLKLLTRGAS